MKKRPLRLAAVLMLVTLAGVTTAVLGSLPQHERLRLQNNFKTPEEVVRYYCARDASGFVWSGLLDKERREFTLWNSTPEAESFYIAEKYEIVPPSGRNLASDTAQVEVRYKVRGISDAFGTLIPAAQPDYRVVFDLKKVNGQWKIAQPEPPRIAPVVLESKFPIAAARP